MTLPLQVSVLQTGIPVTHSVPGVRQGDIQSFAMSPSQRGKSITPSVETVIIRIYILVERSIIPVINSFEFGFMLVVTVQIPSVIYGQRQPVGWRQVTVKTPAQVVEPKVGRSIQA